MTSQIAAWYSGPSSAPIIASSVPSMLDREQRLKGLAVGTRLVHPLYQRTRNFHWLGRCAKGMGDFPFWRKVTTVLQNL